MDTPTKIYVSLGSNLGDRPKMLAGALEGMNAAGVRVLRRSSFYETQPWDAPEQPWFLNAVAEAETFLPAHQLLAELMAIEQAFGRERTIFRGPRTLDLDLLLYGASIIHTEQLEVPHPRMAMRRFVLIPLVELAPDLEHPVLHKSMAELLAESADPCEVRVWEPEGRLNK
jgi:2-amino-4-hydroxy-6-hydroxymethyldihydropteridine diphosphokinase